jgi:hypothetical protein
MKLKKLTLIPDPITLGYRIWLDKWLLPLLGSTDKIAFMNSRDIVGWVELSETHPTRKRFCA